MMEHPSLEQRKISEYISRCRDESSFSEWLVDLGPNTGLIVAEGFEERSLGILRELATNGVCLSSVYMGRYAGSSDRNKRYRLEFEALAETVAPGTWHIMENHNDGLWVGEALSSCSAESAILDITGISNRGIFGTLDSACQSEKQIWIAYSEAGEYWPKEKDWEDLKKRLSEDEDVGKIVDDEPWLFGQEHRVEIILEHEGYDAGGAGRALIAFLPFKCARLAAVLSVEAYSDMLFIAGLPHLGQNSWRLGALTEINSSIIKEWPCIKMKTFNYRNALEKLSSLLSGEDSLFETHDVHMAIMGSKLQTVSCWILSNLVRSITFLTSTPEEYYTDAYSEKVGQSWIFELVRP